MSYRITARDGKKDYKIYYQIYGNNEFPRLLEEYLKNKGVKFDADDCFKNYDVDNIQELFEIMVQISKERIEDNTYYDFTPSAIYKTDTVDGILSYWGYKLDAAIVLTEYNFYKAFEDLIENYWDNTTEEVKYRIKNEKHIYLSGF